MNSRLKKADVERFWSKVSNYGDPDKCWEWQASKTPQGYGHFPLGRTIQIASRIAWEISRGDVPQLHVLHSCDNPSCCNPDHLFLGTNHQNVLDSVNKHRRAPKRGEMNGRHKINAEQAQEIRKRYAQDNTLQKDLAIEYGISQVQIGHIVHGKAWR